MTFLTLPCPFDTALRNAISHTCWGYSSLLKRVCPSSHITVIVAGGIPFHVEQVTSPAETCKGRGLINDEECYLKFR